MFHGIEIPADFSCFIIVIALLLEKKINGSKLLKKKVKSRKKT